MMPRKLARESDISVTLPTKDDYDSEAVRSIDPMEIN